jgi:hypothetical protein
VALRGAGALHHRQQRDCRLYQLNTVPTPLSLFLVIRKFAINIFFSVISDVRVAVRNVRVCTLAKPRVLHV